jgi:hypothetical protein
MRGWNRQTGKLFSYPSPEALVLPDHPLRAIKRLADAALDRLSSNLQHFMHPPGGPRSRLRRCCVPSLLHRAVRASIDAAD